MPKSDKKKTYERRGYMAPLLLDLKKVARPILGKKGFNFIEIVTNWQEIVGQKLSGFATPLKLTFPKGKENSGLLHISVAGGVFATEMIHQKPLLLEKINTYFGYAAVGDIKIIQDSYAPNKVLAKGKPAQTQNKTAPIPEKQLPSSMKSIIAEIDDPELKESLTSLAKLF